MVCPCSTATLGRRGDDQAMGRGSGRCREGRWPGVEPGEEGDTPGDGEGQQPVQRGALAGRRARGRGATRLEMGRGDDWCRGGGGRCRGAGGRERQWPGVGLEESEGPASAQETGGERGGREDRGRGREEHGVGS
jgi:hypothetical protein